MGGKHDFKMVVTSLDKDPLRRISREAIRIRDSLEGEEIIIEFPKDDLTKAKKDKIKTDPKATVSLLNSKREFFLPRLGGGVTNIGNML